MGIIRGAMFKHAALTLSLAATLTAVGAAAAIDAALIPDGTYTLKVQKVMDAQHIAVAMDNGSTTTLSAGRPTVDFSKVQANDNLKASIIKGSVMVYMDMTQH
jgi:hypothetical protein